MSDAKCISHFLEIRARCQQRGIRFDWRPLSVFTNLSRRTFAFINATIPGENPIRDALALFVLFCGAVRGWWIKTRWGRVLRTTVESKGSTFDVLLETVWGSLPSVPLWVYIEISLEFIWLVELIRAGPQMQWLNEYLICVWATVSCSDFSGSDSPWCSQACPRRVFAHICRHGEDLSSANVQFAQSLGPAVLYSMYLPCPIGSSICLRLRSGLRLNIMFNIICQVLASSIWFRDQLAWYTYLNYLMNL